jgi:NIPSNAP
MFYELRKYDVMPGKLPALLDRFGSFTTKRWPDYGIRLVGFWTPDVGAVNNQLIYMFAWESFEERMTRFPAWQADPERAKVWEETEKNGPLVRRVNNLLMQPTDFSQLDAGTPYGRDAAGRAPYLFELREYETTPGRLSSLVKRFGDFTINKFQKIGYRQVGYWTPVMGGNNQTLIYILAWESYEERTKCFGEFGADPERQKVFAASEKDGPIVERIANVMMKPTAFSPMK